MLPSAGPQHPLYAAWKVVVMADVWLDALRREKAAYEAQGHPDRAAEVQAQIDLVTGAAEERKAEPAKAARRGRQTRKGD